MSHQLQFPEYSGQVSMETDTTEENGTVDPENSAQPMDLEMRASENGSEKDTMLPVGNSNGSTHPEASAEEDGDA